jgi:HK97 gp10 family phage protein
MARIETTFKGFNQVVTNLQAIHGKIERGGMRIALTKASKPMLKASKQEARKEERTGTLRKSLRRKVKTNRSGSVAVYIGPDRRVTAEVDGKTHIPANIAHLKEFGFTHTSGKRVEGSHFLETAFEDTKDEAIDIYATEIKGAVQTSAKRLQKKGVI